MIVPGAPIEITLSELLEKVLDIDIAIRYVTNFREIGRPFKSELRIDKTANSCFIFEDKATGKLKYKDFADPNLPTQISIIEYVAIKEGLTIQEAVNKIASEFNIIQSKGITYTSSAFDSIYQSRQSEEEKSSSDLVIKVKRRDWTKVDVDYWNQYYIPIEILERNNIKSISHIWLLKNNKELFKAEFSKNHPVYSYEYYWHDDIFRRKIYRPYSSQYKWISNTDYTVVQNYPNIPKSGDLLFIQSSYKDCMVMEQMGYNSIAPNAESTWLPLNYWEKIKERWKKIIIFGNNDWDKEDNPGLAYAKKHSKRYGVPFIIIPNNETSDISDYAKKYDLNKAKELTESLIKDL